MDFINQRKHPRVNVDFYADWGRGRDCEHFDKITNLSAGGCFLATQKELRSKDIIYIKISGEKFGALKLRGEVKYQFRVRENSPPTGVGVEFQGVSQNEEQTLQDLVTQYRQAGVRT
jgi:Tfp pilus assembly protein PilZ